MNQGTQQLRDVDHYRDMFTRNPGANIGASLAARALATAYPGIDSGATQRYFQGKYPHGIPATDLLRLVDGNATDLPEEVQPPWDYFIIHLFAEHCQGKAGRPYHFDDFLDFLDGVDPDDLVVYEGTRAELLDVADLLDLRAKSAAAGSDLYFLRSAASIREAVERTRK
ncbi:MAG TPA: hypothetical protein PKI11_04740 [Candidatus Hydrogenedentes bacterium]|nr:hypothetical protein [Candidatus Hydrogenedentota bacterium]HNT89593.1 hypothetical protein [Candidatus Hydrogenedentota bacterium]